MLQELSKKNKKWLKMAYNLCGCYDLAGDLVQDMYLKMYDANERKPFTEIKDGLIWGVLRGLFIDKCRNDDRYKLVSLDAVLNNPDNNQPFEVDDKELMYLSRAKQLRYLSRYYLEKSYDHSLRGLAELNGAKYWDVNRKLQEGRKHILKDEIHLYSNKRNKHNKK
jgi:DNA-directed RNA polymerase specialized sigma24 family protein